LRTRNGNDCAFGVPTDLCTESRCATAAASQWTATMQRRRSRPRLIQFGLSNLLHQYGDLYSGPEFEAEALIQ